MSTLLPPSVVESEYTTYLRNQNIANIGTNVWKALNTQEVTTPAVFVIAGKDQELQPFSKLYKVPFQVRVVYTAADVQEDPDGLALLTNTVENALTGSQQTINSTSNQLFIFSVSNPIHDIEVVENAYHYIIDTSCICKTK